MRSPILWLLSILMLLAVPALSRTVTIAVVRDGPSADDALVSAIESELKKILSDHTIVFRADAAFNAGWNAERLSGCIQAAMKDRTIDIILGVGALATQAAARPELTLTKPFISSFDSRARMPTLPWSGDGSTKANLALIVLPQNATREIAALRDLKGFTRIHVIIEHAYIDNVSGFREGLDQYAQETGVELVAVPITNDIAPVLAELDSDVQAVYLTGAPQLSEAQRRTLLEEMVRRKIPVFSGKGRPDVEMGALAAITPDISELIVRRSALNISRVVRGETTADLPVTLATRPDLVINGRTAAAIAFPLNYEARTYATVLHPEALEPDADPIDIKLAMSTALAGNAEFAARTASVEITRHDKDRALSPMLPQVGADAAWEDHEPLASSSFFPSRVGVAGIGVTQMIYDDDIVSGYRSAGRIYDADRYDLDATRMDVLALSGRAYLEFVRNGALLKVEIDNVRLTEDNLELARIRADVGYSGPDEVFRWESELAQRRASMLDAEAALEAALIRLNRVLGTQQSQRWSADETTVDPNSYFWADIDLREILIDPALSVRLKEFFVGFGLENAPELAALDMALEAQGIQVGNRKRRFFIPDFFASFDYNYLWDYEPTAPGIRDDTWSVRLAATYPIFTGADRVFDLRREQASYDTVEKQRESVRQELEQEIRTSMRLMEASFPSIGLGKKAADSSRLNLDVVRDKYAQGIVNITNLLDAQNQSFTAEQQFVVSTYRFLIDIIGFERSISWFSIDKSQADYDALGARIQASAGAR